MRLSSKIIIRYDVFFEGNFRIVRRPFRIVRRTSMTIEKIVIEHYILLSLMLSGQKTVFVNHNLMSLIAFGEVEHHFLFYCLIPFT